MFNSYDRFLVNNWLSNKSEHNINVLPDDRESSHWHVWHGAEQEVEQDREEGRVDADHWVHPCQHAVRHTLNTGIYSPIQLPPPLP